jgi:hypothetical protein
MTTRAGRIHRPVPVNESMTDHFPSRLITPTATTDRDEAEASELGLSPN